MNSKKGELARQNTGIDQTILKSLVDMDTVNSLPVEYAQRCLMIYEETLFAMGFYARGDVSRVVDNSQLSYFENGVREENYADFSGHYWENK